jgi:hypothetical protein
VFVSCSFDEGLPCTSKPKLTWNWESSMISPLELGMTHPQIAKAPPRFFVAPNYLMVFGPAGGFASRSVSKSRTTRS